MITEEYIKSISGIVIEDNTYLFDSRHRVAGYRYNVEVHIDGDFCPYCGSPRPVDCPISGGPGSWIYRTYACGTKAAIRYAGPTDDLLAISKPSASCLVYASLVTAKDEDDVI